MLILTQSLDTDHDDRIQNDDLTQKHDFRFGARGTEDLPRSPVDGVRRAGTVFRYVDNEYLYCRLVLIHGWNGRSSYAWLVFIDDESFGIDPAVEFRRISEHFTNSSLRLPTLRRSTIDSTRYSLSIGTATLCNSCS